MTYPSILHDLPFTIPLNFPYKLNKKKKMLLSLGYNKLKIVLFFSFNWEGREIQWNESF